MFYYDNEHQKVALEHLPIEWLFNWSGDPVCTVSAGPVWSSPESWFGIKDDEEKHLFYLGLQNTEKFGGKILSTSSTLLDVADNIRAFLEIKKKEQDNGQ